MKLPHRRKFLHLAAGAAALPALSRLAWAQTYRIELKGESMRKLKLTAREQQETMKPDDQDQQNPKAAKSTSAKAHPK